MMQHHFAIFLFFLILNSVSASYIVSFVGTGSSGSTGDDGPASEATIMNPYQAWIDSNSEYLYFTDSGAHRVRRVHTPSNIIFAFAGIGTPSTSGDGGSATACTLNTPIGIWGNSVGEVYVSEKNGHVVRVINESGIITRVAGTGIAGSPDTSGGYTPLVALDTPLYTPMLLSGRANGDVYIPNYTSGYLFVLSYDTKMLSWTTQAGGACMMYYSSVLSIYAPYFFSRDFAHDVNDVYDEGLYAGTFYSGGYSGDGGPAVSAKLYYPTGIWVSSVTNNLYIADSGNHAIRMVERSSRIISTIAGTGSPGNTGDGGDATSALLQNPMHILGDDNSGDTEVDRFYICDQGNHRIRMLVLGLPTAAPTIAPTKVPTVPPTHAPTATPTGQPSSFPSAQPLSAPSAQPSTQPTSEPTMKPSTQPSTMPTLEPFRHPSSMPTGQPSSFPSVQPLSAPSAQPSTQPTSEPTMTPSTQPSTRPSMPTGQPSSFPSVQPLSAPSAQPSTQPTSEPTMKPSTQPSTMPTLRPLMHPSSMPTGQPSSFPSVQPFSAPSAQPFTQPTSEPTMTPSTQPSTRPTLQPFMHPSSIPTTQPSSVPSLQPLTRPSSLPTTMPSLRPSTCPTMQPSINPSVVPSVQPTESPTVKPSSQPSNLPSVQPLAAPTNIPSNQPSSSPTSNPTCPSSVPTSQPSVDPLGCAAGEYYSNTRKICWNCTEGSISEPGVSTCACKGGYAQASTGDTLRCDLCVAGQYAPAGSTTCLTAIAGSYAARGGSAEYKLCPVGTYSAVEGADSADACTQCKGGEITPTAGSITIDQCLSPLPNFILGTFMLVAVFVMTYLYVAKGRFFRIAFHRRQLVVLPLTTTCDNLMTIIEEDIHFGAKIGTFSSSYRALRLFAFIIGAIIIIVLVSALFYGLYIAGALFTALIVYRGMKLGVSVNFQENVLQFMSQMGIAFGFPRLDQYLRPVLEVLWRLAALTFSFDQISVTCAGAQAPLELVNNMLILGIAIMFIIAGYQFLWTNYVLEMHLILSRKLVMARTGTFLGLIGNFGMLLLVGVMSVINPSQPVLRYLMGFVNIGTFVAYQGYRHAYTEACDQLTAAPFMDTILSTTSTIVAYWLILPVFYTVATVLIPGCKHMIQQTAVESKLHSEEVALSSRHTVDMFAIDETVTVPTAQTKAIAQEASRHLSHKHLNSFSFDEEDGSSHAIEHAALQYLMWHHQLHRNESSPKKEKGLNSVVTSTQLAQGEVENGATDDDYMNAAKSGRSVTIAEPVEEEEAVGDDDYMSRWPVLKLLCDQIAAVYKGVASFFALDLWFCKLVSQWFVLVAYKVTTDKEHVTRRLARAAARSELLSSRQQLAEHRNHTSTEVVPMPKETPKLRRAQTIMEEKVAQGSFKSHPVVLALALTASEFAIAEQRDYEAYHTTEFPYYHELCEAVHIELLSKFSDRGGGRGRREGCLPVLVTRMLAYLGIGQFITRVGRRHWRVVMWKYFTFLLITLGIWSDDNQALEAYGFDTNFHEISDITGRFRRDFKLMEARDMMSRRLEAEIGTRTIMLMMFPILAGYSVLAMSVAGFPPLLYSRRMRKALAPLLYHNPMYLAELVEREEYRLQKSTKKNHFRSTRIYDDDDNDDNDISMLKGKHWKLRLRAVHLFFEQSRLVQFALNVYLFLLGVAILLGNHQLWILSTFIFLIPYCIIRSLIFVMYWGAYLNILDVDLGIKESSSSPTETPSEANSRSNSHSNSNSGSRSPRAVAPEPITPSSVKIGQQGQTSTSKSSTPNHHSIQLQLQLQQRTDPNTPRNHHLTAGAGAGAVSPDPVSTLDSSCKTGSTTDVPSSKPRILIIPNSSSVAPEEAVAAAAVTPSCASTYENSSTTTTTLHAPHSFKSGEPSTNTNTERRRKEKEEAVAAVKARYAACISSSGKTAAQTEMAISSEGVADKHIRQKEDEEEEDIDAEDALTDSATLLSGQQQEQQRGNWIYTDDINRGDSSPRLTQEEEEQQQQVEVQDNNAVGKKTARILAFRRRLEVQQRVLSSGASNAIVRDDNDTSSSADYDNTPGDDDSSATRPISQKK